MDGCDCVDDRSRSYNGSPAFAGVNATTVEVCDMSKEELEQQDAATAKWMARILAGVQTELDRRCGGKREVLAKDWAKFIGSCPTRWHYGQIATAILKGR